MPGHSTNQSGTRALRVAIIGSGFGGIATAVKLQEAGFTDFTVFEKNPGPGGTWWENSYPGAQVDVISAYYSYSFMYDYDWPRSFANQDEVQKYIEDVIDKYGIRSHFRFNAPVREVVWNDATNTYTVHTPQGIPQEFNVVVSGVGMLNDPVVPDWPGLDDFQGPKFHTARWQHQHDLAGKRVAVVGTGSTASQVVPAIAPTVGHLFLFQREPGFVLPKGDRVFTQAERYKLRRWPILQKLDRIKSFVNIERFRSAARPLAAAQRMLHVGIFNTAVNAQAVFQCKDANCNGIQNDELQIQQVLDALYRFANQSDDRNDHPKNNEVVKKMMEFATKMAHEAPLFQQRTETT